MEERVSAYDIFHRPQKAWNTFSAQIKHAENDLFIITANRANMGEIPRDIQKSLRSLRDTINRALAE